MREGNVFNRVCLSVDGVGWDPMHVTITYDTLDRMGPYWTGTPNGVDICWLLKHYVRRKWAVGILLKCFVSHKMIYSVGPLWEFMRIRMRQILKQQTTYIMHLN